VSLDAISDAISSQESRPSSVPPRSDFPLLPARPALLESRRARLAESRALSCVFFNQQTVLAWSVNYSWSFLIPIVIALVFSFVHGAFTGAFWDAVGLKPKSVEEK